MRLFLRGQTLANNNLDKKQFGWNSFRIGFLDFQFLFGV